ncbi:MAG: AzlC family ABC transporter permease [Clostridium sp.]|uniref:AzlC family ABC transporter permease n=1 Tax=Clostridium sp. TaxID=1506 RepID=UPI0039ECEAD5
MIKEKEYFSGNSLFFQGIKDCIPTIFGYLSIGFACGVVSKSCGMTILQIVAMSTFIYAGSSQFIAASMILSIVSAPSVILTIFLVNLRHLLMSASIAPYFKGNSLLKNFISGILLTDETFVLASTKGSIENRISYKWMLGINITAYLNWIFATFLGASFGSLIYNYKVFGLDFALPAMFIGLLISSIKEQSNKKNSIIIIFSTVIILIALIKFISVNTAIMIASIAGALIGMVIDK